MAGSGSNTLREQTADHDNPLKTAAIFLTPLIIATACTLARSDFDPQAAQHQSAITSILTLYFLQFSAVGGFFALFNSAEQGIGGEWVRGLAMIPDIFATVGGMISALPIVIPFFEHCFYWYYYIFSTPAHAACSFLDPTMQAGTVAELALAKASGNSSEDVLNTSYPASVLSYFLGDFISFSLPVGLLVINDPDSHRYLLLGLIPGLVAIPVTCFVCYLILYLEQMNNGLGYVLVNSKIEPSPVLDWELRIDLVASTIQVISPCWILAAVMGLFLYLQPPGGAGKDKNIKGNISSAAPLVPPSSTTPAPPILARTNSNEAAIGRRLSPRGSERQFGSLTSNARLTQANSVEFFTPLPLPPATIKSHPQLKTILQLPEGEGTKQIPKLSDGAADETRTPEIMNYTPPGRDAEAVRTPQIHEFFEGILTPSSITKGSVVGFQDNLEELEDTGTTFDLTNVYPEPASETRQIIPQLSDRPSTAFTSNAGSGLDSSPGGNINSSIATGERQQKTISFESKPPVGLKSADNLDVPDSFGEDAGTTYPVAANDKPEDLLVITLFVGFGTMLNYFLRFMFLISALQHIGGCIWIFQTFLPDYPELQLQPLLKTSSNAVFFRYSESTGLDVAASIGIAVSGMLPFMFLLREKCIYSICRVGKFIGFHDEEGFGILGIVGSLSSMIVLFTMLPRIAPKEAVAAVAFSIPAAYSLGGHLAFSSIYQPPLCVPLLIGKLIGGVFAMGLARLTTCRLVEEDQKEHSPETVARRVHSSEFYGAQRRTTLFRLGGDEDSVRFSGRDNYDSIRSGIGRRSSRRSKRVRSTVGGFSPPPPGSGTTSAAANTRKSAALKEYLLSLESTEFFDNLEADLEEDEVENKSDNSSDEDDPQIQTAKTKEIPARFDPESAESDENNSGSNYEAAGTTSFRGSSKDKTTPPRKSKVARRRFKKGALVARMIKLLEKEGNAMYKQKGRRGRAREVELSPREVLVDAAGIKTAEEKRVLAGTTKQRTEITAAAQNLQQQKSPRFDQHPHQQSPVRVMDPRARGFEQHNPLSPRFHHRKSAFVFGGDEVVPLSDVDSDVSSIDAARVIKNARNVHVYGNHHLPGVSLPRVNNMCNHMSVYDSHTQKLLSDRVRNVMKRLQVIGARTSKEGEGVDGTTSTRGNGQRSRRTDGKAPSLTSRDTGSEAEINNPAAGSPPAKNLSYKAQLQQTKAKLLRHPGSGSTTGTVFLEQGSNGNRDSDASTLSAPLLQQDYEELRRRATAVGSFTRNSDDGNNSGVSETELQRSFDGVVKDLRQTVL
ncbi:unnamed protein product [Amoebophrya sp. A120]|nr:unnamed protein product [Amoebophrya sp. A120]|eukprot:GSA120T00022209001.1